MKAPLTCRTTALEQILAQRIAVDRDEGLVLAQAVVVNRARNHFLAGSAFPGDQDGAVGRCTLGDQPIDALHRRTGPDDVLETVLGTDLASEIEVLLQQSAPLQRPFHHKLEFIGIEGLRQVVESPELHAPHGGLDLGQSGDHDDVDVRVRLLYPLQHFHAVHPGHHDIEDQHVITTLVYFRKASSPSWTPSTGNCSRPDAEAAANDDLRRRLPVF